MRKLEHSESGFSLVESLVAMALLSINMMGLLSMFIVAQEGIASGARGLNMTALVESKLERLRAVPYAMLLQSAVKENQTIGPALKDDGMDGDKVAGDGEYSAREIINGVVMTWSVRPDGGVLSQSRSSSITVSAEWADPRGKGNRTVRLFLRRASPVYRGGTSL